MATTDSISDNIPRKCNPQNLNSPRRKTAADYHVLAQQKGFEWVGDLPQTTDHTTSWRCSNGHNWDTSYKSVRQSGCPVCAGIIRKTSDDYRNLAQSRGFTWLGSEVRNAGTKTKWRCSRGHEWEAPYNSIRQGHGCETCIRPGVPIEVEKERKKQWAKADRAANPEKHKTKKREWRRNNPHKTWEENHRRLSRLRELPYNFTVKDRKRMMEYWDNACAVTGETDDVHIDHWIPLASSDCPGTIPSNLIPLAGRLNMSKQHKNPRQWLIEVFGETEALKIEKRIQDYFEWVANRE